MTRAARRSFYRIRNSDFAHRTAAASVPKSVQQFFRQGSLCASQPPAALSSLLLSYPSPVKPIHPILLYPPHRPFFPEVHPHPPLPPPSPAYAGLCCSVGHFSNTIHFMSDEISDKNSSAPYQKYHVLNIDHRLLHASKHCDFMNSVRGKREGLVV